MSLRAHRSSSLSLSSWFLVTCALASDAFCSASCRCSVFGDDTSTHVSCRWIKGFYGQRWNCQRFFWGWSLAHRNCTSCPIASPGSTTEVFAVAKMHDDCFARLSYEELAMPSVYYEGFSTAVMRSTSGAGNVPFLTEFHHRLPSRHKLAETQRTATLVLSLGQSGNACDAGFCDEFCTNSDPPKWACYVRGFLVSKCVDEVAEDTFAVVERVLNF